MREKFLRALIHHAAILVSCIESLAFPRPDGRSSLDLGSAVTQSLFRFLPMMRPGLASLNFSASPSCQLFTEYKLADETTPDWVKHHSVGLPRFAWLFF